MAVTDRLTERQISRLRKDFEQKRNRHKMKERLKTRRQEKRGRRHDPPRRDREAIDLIDEFFDREADFDE